MKILIFALLLSSCAELLPALNNKAIAPIKKELITSTKEVNMDVKKLREELTRRDTLNYGGIEIQATYFSIPLAIAEAKVDGKKKMLTEKELQHQIEQYKSIAKRNCFQVSVITKNEAIETAQFKNWTLRLQIDDKNHPVTFEKSALVGVESVPKIISTFGDPNAWHNAGFACTKNLKLDKSFILHFIPSFREDKAKLVWSIM
ncbi:MAG: hypothetical protein H6621_06545 [Halobacteriovoraceae bacterium]|nr:hypothetical protein [Halobacteriovoraceae bacterium]